MKVTDLDNIKNSLRNLSNYLDIYTKISNQINMNFASILNDYSNLTRFEFNRLDDSIKKSLKLYSNIDLASIIHNLNPTLTYLSEAIDVYKGTDFNESFMRSISDTMNSLTSSFAYNQIKELQNLDYSSILKSACENARSMMELIDTSYLKIQDELSFDFEQDDEDFNDFKDSIPKQMSDPIGFQEKIGEWAESKKRKYYIYVSLFMFVYTTFIQPYIQEYIGKPFMTAIMSNVKKEPSKNSEVINKIEEGVEVFVSEDTKYYYKVIFINDDGEIKEGYVAKRNLKEVEIDDSNGE